MACSETGVTPAVSYAGYYGYSFEEFVEAAVRACATAVELIPDQGPNLLAELTPERRSALRTRLRGAGVTPVVHSVFYDINLVSVVPDVQELALRVIARCGEFARDIGAREVVVHPGYRFPGWRSSEFQRRNADDAARRGVEKLSALADKLDVDMFLENGSYFVTDREKSTTKPLHYGIFLDEIDLLLEFASSRVGICLDYGKAKVSQLPVRELIRRHGGRPFRFQVGSGRRLRELLLEQGLKAVLHTPRQITFEGPAEDLAAFMAVAAGAISSSDVEANRAT